VSPDNDPPYGSGAAAPDTLCKLYMHAMRCHSRRAALRSVRGGRLVDVPDWRLDRQVIRLALFVRERLGFTAGQTAAIVAPFDSDAVIADLAVIASGAASAFIPRAFPDAALADAFAAADPHLLFVSDANDLERARRLRALSSDSRRVIVFDTAASGGAVPLADALDFGGTLDTAERANAFRARARGVLPSAAAIAQASLDASGRLRYDTLTHEAVCDRLAMRQPDAAGRAAARANAFGASPTLEDRLRFYGCLAGGAETAALGGVEDIADASAPAARAAAAAGQSAPRGAARARRSWRALFDRRLPS
jgi:acyl-CoA synthetase (AMP-forming)/AMP-acid ligase II